MNKSTLGIIVVLLLIFSSVYWFGLRPGEVRKGCWRYAQTQASSVASSEAKMIERGESITRADYEKVRDDSYKSCLLEHGLAK